MGSFLVCIAAIAEYKIDNGQGRVVTCCSDAVISWI